MPGWKNILKGREFFFIDYSAGLHYLAKVSSSWCYHRPISPGHKYLGLFGDNTTQVKGKIIPL
jgi:hypothetical protein